MGTPGQTQSGTPEALEELALLGQSISSSIRLELLIELARGPRRVSRLMRVLDLSQSLVSHHLKKLRDGGLVSRGRAGDRRIYQLTPRVEIDTRARPQVLQIRTAIGMCRFNLPDRIAHDRIEIKPAQSNGALAPEGCSTERTRLRASG